MFPRERSAPTVSRVTVTLREITEDDAEAVRAVHADGRPVGFVMLSWDVEPQPPDINGPWFLWKLLIDQDHQRKGYGTETLRQVVDLVRRHGGTELLTSYVPGEGGPAGFYARLGFVPTGDVDPEGEILLRLPLA
jgi:GNAT superfamily N-acetyltransferase